MSASLPPIGDNREAKKPAAGQKSELKKMRSLNQATAAIVLILISVCGSPVFGEDIADTHLQQFRDSVQYFLRGIPSVLDVSEARKKYFEDQYKTAMNPKLSTADIEKILRALEEKWESNDLNRTNVELRADGECFIKIYDDAYLPRLRGQRPQEQANSQSQPSPQQEANGSRPDAPIEKPMLGLQPDTDELYKEPFTPEKELLRPAPVKQEQSPTPPGPSSPSSGGPKQGAERATLSNKAPEGSQSTITGIGGNSGVSTDGAPSQKLIGNVFHNTVIPSGTATGHAEVNSLGSDSVHAPTVAITVPPNTLNSQSNTAPRTNTTGASSMPTSLPFVPNLPSPPGQNVKIKPALLGNGKTNLKTPLALRDTRPSQSQRAARPAITVANPSNGEADPPSADTASPAGTGFNIDQAIDLVNGLSGVLGGAASMAGSGSYSPPPTVVRPQTSAPVLQRIPRPSNQSTITGTGN